ncbi:MAG: hypothetical protein ACP5TZ_00605 [Nitrososphaeria archaeon]
MSKLDEDLNEKLNKIKEDGLKLREILEKLKQIRDEKESIRSKLRETRPQGYYSDKDILEAQRELIEIEKRIETTVMKKKDEDMEYKREKELAKRLEIMKSKKKVSDERNKLVDRLKELNATEQPLRDDVRKLIEEREGLKKEAEVLRIKLKLMKYKEKEKEERKEERKREREREKEGISVNLGGQVNMEKVREEIKKKLQEGQPVSLDELKVMYEGDKSR